MTDNTVFITIFQESFLLLLIIGSLFALLLGLLFLLSPTQAEALSLRYSHWYSLRQTTKSLEIPHSTEHYFYRRHRSVGFIIILSATYILYRFAFDYEQTAATHILSSVFGETIFIKWFLEAFLWFLLPISGLLILFGTTLVLKPSSLKGIEKKSNHWVSTRKISQPIESQNKNLDRWVNSHPRRFAVMLLFASGYNLFMLILFLF